MTKTLIALSALVALAAPAAAQTVSPRVSSQIVSDSYQGNTGGFSVSAATKELIEQEVHGLIEQGYVDARRILLEKSEEFERLAKGLLEYETLTGEDIGRIIRGEALGGDDDTPSSSIPSVTAIPRAGTAGPAPDAAPQPQG